jgi:arsenate reductase
VHRQQLPQQTGGWLTHRTQEEIEAAFEATLEQIRTRIEAFLALPLKQLSAEQLKAELALIGTL